MASNQRRSGGQISGMSGQTAGGSRSSKSRSGSARNRSTRTATQSSNIGTGGSYQSFKLPGNYNITLTPVTGGSRNR